MSFLRPSSLRWRLVQRLAIAQGLVIVTLSVLSYGVIAVMWLSGTISGGRYQFSVADTVSSTLYRESSGKLALADTSELNTLRLSLPDFWFIVRDRMHNEIHEGIPPAAVEQLLPTLSQFNTAQIGTFESGDSTAVGVVQWVSTRAGDVQIIASAGGKVTIRQILYSTQGALWMAVYLTILVVFATAAVTPLIVRRAMRSLDAAAEQAEQIDIDRIGARLLDSNVPLEALPFVSAVNDALARLDRGYEGHKRFLADAAHELRTPIAILTTRLSTLPAGATRSRLLEDAARLSTLADQLLDLQRLTQQELQLCSVNLTQLAKRVVLDLAPLTFGAGYEMIFEPESESIVVQGDQLAIERALTNLIQNAINYGGRRGAITVSISVAGWIEVCDEGEGIPEAAREKVFEAFQRLGSDARGVGLGLDLVQKIMRLHGGHAEIASASKRGACFRLVFPI